MDARRAWQQWTDWVLTTDPAQRLRLSMAGLAALLMVACMLVMNGVAWAGLTARTPVLVWSVLCSAGLVVVYVASRSGWSQRCADPSLTLPQIVYAMASNAVAYTIAGPARGVTLPILAVILMFGIFGLSTRQMLGVLLYGLVAFGTALGVVAWHHEAGHEPALEIAHAAMIVVVLLPVALTVMFPEVFPVALPAGTGWLFLAALVLLACSGLASVRVCEHKEY